MKCDLCSRPVVAYLKYFNRKLCKEHFVKLTEDRIRRTISKSKLFDRNEKVAVAVSGGKSSVSLLGYLVKFQEKMPLELHAIIIDEGIKGYSKKNIKKAIKSCEELGVPYELARFRDHYKITTDKKKCAYCENKRFRLLNKIARKLKANKIATAHNLDYEVQSILVKYFRGEFQAKPRKGNILLVKPLRRIPDDEIELYATLQGYKFCTAECPARTSFRCTIQDKLNELEKTHPGTKFQIQKSADGLNQLLKKQC